MPFCKLFCLRVLIYFTSTTVGFHSLPGCLQLLEDLIHWPEAHLQYALNLLVYSRLVLASRTLGDKMYYSLWAWLQCRPWGEER